MELRPSDALKEWKAGRLRPVYYLFGEDASGKAEAIEALKAAVKADDFNLREFSGDPDAQAAAIVTEAMTLPVFAERRLVIVKNPKIPAGARAALADYLKRPLPSTVLVLLSDEKKPDMKDALARAAAAAGAVCLFYPLRVEEALERLAARARQAGKTLTQEAAATLVEEAGTDWAILGQELEKALLFSSSEEVSVEDVRQCLGYQRSADPFALPRLIQERRLKESLSHVQRMLREGKADDQAFRALSQITSAVSKQFRAKGMLAAGAAPDEIFRSLRLNAWYDKDYLGKLARLTERRLLRDLKLCLLAETALKSKSWLDPKIELEHLVIGLCRPGQALTAVS